MSGALAIFAVAVAVALLGVELKRRLWLMVGKPVATLALVAVVWSGPSNPLLAVVGVGMLLSAVGDTALLMKGPTPFMVGMGTFLIAHLLYAGAFLVGGGGPAWSFLVGVAIFGGASGWLVRRMWPTLAPWLRAPITIYTAACTTMAASSMSTLMGPWPAVASAAAALGGTLFFVSDSNLAWNDFVEPYPHGQTVTLSLYWSGQLGIALAARWSSGG